MAKIFFAGLPPRTPSPAPLSPSTSRNLKSVYRSPLTPDSGSGEHRTPPPSCRNELLVAMSIGTEIIVRAERAGATRTYARSALKP